MMARRTGSFALVLLIALESSGAQFYNVANGTQQTVDKFGTCRVVANNTGFGLFVPTNTASEWAEFRGHLPAGVTLTNCGPAPTPTPGPFIPGPTPTPTPVPTPSLTWTFVQQVPVAWGDDSGLVKCPATTSCSTAGAQCFLGPLGTGGVYPNLYMVYRRYRCQ